MRGSFAAELLAIVLAYGCGTDAIIANTGPGGDGSAGRSCVASEGKPLNLFVSKLEGGSGCLSRILPRDSPTQACRIVEASTNSDGGACSAPGRLPVTCRLADSVAAQMRTAGLCDAAQSPSPACSEFHFCEIAKADDSCLTTSPNPNSSGWCYVDPANGIGDPALVAQCPSNEQRMLRFIGPDTPAPGAITLIACGPPI